MAKAKGRTAQNDPVKNAEAHGWVSTGGGEILAWAEGKTALGTVVGVREGMYGPLLTIRSPRGEVQTWGCPKILSKSDRRAGKGRRNHHPLHGVAPCVQARLLADVGLRGYGETQGRNDPGRVRPTGSAVLVIARLEFACPRLCALPPRVHYLGTDGEGRGVLRCRWCGAQFSIQEAREVFTNSKGEMTAYGTKPEAQGKPVGAGTGGA